MKIFKNSVAIYLTIDEFIKVLEEDIFEDVIMLVLALDTGFEYFNESDSDDDDGEDEDEDEDNNSLFPPEYTLIDLQNGLESNEDKVDRLYRTFYKHRKQQ